MSGWYALSVRARSELRAAEGLRERVNEVFLPLRRERRPWSDRVITADVPVFPGYLFVRTAMSAEKRVELLRVRPVLDVVGRSAGDNHRTRCIPQAELEALRVVVEAERALDPVERLVVGKHVSVVAGPLRGARGIIEVGADGRGRLVVQISLLGRGVRTVLRADDVVESLDAAA